MWKRGWEGLGSGEGERDLEREKGGREGREVHVYKVIM